MREILTREEMALIILDKRGYFFNRRPDARNIHRASCEALSAMVVKEYPKYFFDDAAEARQWLDDQLGVRGWTNCGRCMGLPG